MQDSKRLSEVKMAAAGMLPLPVYAEIYLAARTCGGGDIVEIGTAQGAATIVLALGARASGQPFHIWSVDPMNRGSRISIGSPSDNIALVRSTLGRFGVTDDVTLVTGEVGELLTQPRPSNIALLLIDADGCIDRDLSALFSRLRTEASIIIDDVVDRAFVRKGPAGWEIFQKHRLTHHLVDACCTHGLLVEQRRVFQTGFFLKGPAERLPENFTELSLNAYRHLTHCLIAPGQMGARAAARRFAGRFLPRLVSAYRRLRYPRI